MKKASVHNSKGNPNDKTYHVIMQSSSLLLIHFLHTFSSIEVHSIPGTQLSIAITHVGFLQYTQV